MRHAFAIPFRDRGTDRYREMNLYHVVNHLEDLKLGKVYVVSDGREGDALFNRSAAYNKAMDEIPADIITFHESDMIVLRTQLAQAITMAETPGLVVPFHEYRYLGIDDSAHVRHYEKDVTDCRPESVMANGRSVGAINTLSRASVEAIGGWDEQFEGSWYDDRAMSHAFEICCGPTRFVPGIGYHLYHLPGFTGDHLTAEERIATVFNKRRYGRYKLAHTPEQIRRLTGGTR